MPTLTGTAPKWGIENDETSLIIESIDYDYKSKEKEVLNKDGEPTGHVSYAETCDISLKGEVPAAGAPTTKLASHLALANGVLDRFSTTPTGGRTIVKSIKDGKNREDMQKFECSATYYPLIPAGV